MSEVEVIGARSRAAERESVPLLRARGLRLAGQPLRKPRQPGHPLVAWCILAGLTEGRRTVSWPDPSYYLVLAASLLLDAAAVVATFRTARKNTGIAVTRFE